MNTLPFAETNSIVKYNTIFVCHLNNEAKFTTDHRSFGRHKRKWFKNGDHHQRIYYVRRRPFACHRQELIKFITCHIIGIVIEFAHRKNFEFYCIEWYYLMRLLNRVQFFYTLRSKIYYSIVVKNTLSILANIVRINSWFDVNDNLNVNITLNTCVLLRVCFFNGGTSFCFIELFSGG